MERQRILEILSYKLKMKVRIITIIAIVEIRKPLSSLLDLYSPYPDRSTGIIMAMGFATTLVGFPSKPIWITSFSGKMINAAAANTIVSIINVINIIFFFMVI